MASSTTGTDSPSATSPIRLIAKQAGTLLPVVLNREITIDQVHLIRLLIDATNEADEADLERLAGILAFDRWLVDDEPR